MRKLMIIATMICLLFVPMKVHAEERNNSQSSVEFTYTPKSTIHIDKGNNPNTGIVNTGDSNEIGVWMMFTSVAFILLLLLIFFSRDKEEAENEVY